MTIIDPRVSVGPFRFGMTRAEAWGATRSVITSFYPQQWSTDRTDDFRDQAIHADYDGGSIARLVAFTSNRPYAARCPISLFEQELGPESDWDDIVALLELQEVPFVEDDERIDLPELGLAFGFVERGDEERRRLEWVSAEAEGRAAPFTRAG